MITLTPNDYNGLLRVLPGEFITAGGKLLPAPSAAEKQTPVRKVEIDVPPLGGRVRITFELKEYRHHKSRNWSWLARWADAVDGSP